MKKLLILATLSWVSLLPFACETEQDPFHPGGGTGGSGGGKLSLDCNNPSSIKGKYHCLSSGSNEAPCYYGDAELTGTWRNPDFDAKMTLNSDGTGTWTIIGGSSQSLTWGVLVNSDGTKTGDPNGWYVIINNGSRSGIIDPQFAANGYLPSQKLFTNGWTR